MKTVEEIISRLELLIDYDKKIIEVLEKTKDCDDEMQVCQAILRVDEQILAWVKS